MVATLILVKKTFLGDKKDFTLDYIGSWYGKNIVYSDDLEPLIKQGYKDISKSICFYEA